MQITILAGFVTILTLVESGVISHAAPPWVGAGAYLLGSIALSFAAAAIPLREMRRGRHGDLPARRDRLWDLASQAWLVLGLGAAVWSGWGRWVCDDLGLVRVPLAWFLALAAPLVAAAFARWFLEYPLQREIRSRLIRRQVEAGLPPRPVWSRRDYVLFRVRQDLLMMGIPLVLILTFRDGIALYAAPSHPPSWWAGAMEGATAAGALCVLMIAPWLIVRAWGTRDLPDGPVRQALLRVREESGTRLGRLLLWPTGGSVANAAVLGVLAPWRYALLSDALIEQLSPRDVEAVFHHEVRHVQAHHLFYLMMYVVSAATLSAAAASGLVELAQWVARGAIPANYADAAAQIGSVVLLAAAAGLTFGPVSRRFERQCDVYSAWRMGFSLGAAGAGQERRITLEGAAAFSWALQRIAQVNCSSIEQRNWRHGSIASRVRFLVALSAGGGTIDQVDRGVRRIKVLIWLAAIAAAGILSASAAMEYYR